MIESKYYTPEIEEFYVGFEYEILNYKTNNFEKIIYPADYIEANIKPIQLLEYIKRGSMKVKYLDKEDIESLGWKYLNKNETFCYGVNEEWGLSHVKNIIEITYYGECNFNGIIKNKSELKKLMKQLQING